MLSAVTVSKQTIEFRDSPQPTLQPGYALVRVHNVTLCGTDLHIWEDDYPTELPLIQGHEFSGIVEALGDTEDHGIRIGERVAVNPIIYCGQCRPCLTGRYNVCQNVGCLGCYSDGALSELISVPVDKLCRVPDELPLDIAAMGEPASIAMQAVNRGRPQAGETALVLGSGPIGLLATLYLTELEVRVVCADTEQHRLDLALEFGATETLLVTPGTEFPDAYQAPRLDALTDHCGPELVIEATGVPSSLENAIRLVASAGRIVQVGISPRQAAVSMKDIPYKELDIMGSRMSLNLIPDGLALLARHPEQAHALMTHRFAFADLQQAYQLMQGRTEKIGKILIQMPAGSAA
ncbi:alcohol dehydrogenase catalytic domain-containing protein [Paenarthrobacter aurescens]|uniref:2-deoxy-scyllo-inosamine dehydrogenase n=1 Tax=Paenarthrobacter aurescens TaxID=43663 RepID=A0A4Y3NES1_PAEAU|nr:alcohol dehydrogenase catalytic domain-containing protein [Paenarthrobacter aurescens]MDO6144808.1 alcohol dehydrogenase catalytic domain-containing protein [Paenarthrobacter aurescens]MDO6148653.1 alcohol dehydrogenase catalytic domain-containing protein [Paenarthrobacter aurescens]MDO6159899.1 alcohol dehydrogenase catalytic domain-containing protein [Paenarthrobacter aurescens]MDO6163758.1 alcohol dehydrogenase catalytic domain-containing protein [Paenarthrobacter aurescens]GEB17531.1 2-